jgi:hypothetical protein
MKGKAGLKTVLTFTAVAVPAVIEEGQSVAVEVYTRVGDPEYVAVLQVIVSTCGVIHGEMFWEPQ